MLTANDCLLRFLTGKNQRHTHFGVQAFYVLLSVSYSYSYRHL